MATDRISVRLDEEKIQFLEQVGYDPTKEKGARTRGVEAVIAFAQLLSLPFQSFLDGVDNWMIVGIDFDEKTPTGDYSATFKVARNKMGGFQILGMEVSKCAENN